MAKKEIKQDEKPQFEKYAYANLAMQLGSSEETAQYFGGALSLFRKDYDLEKDSKAKILYEGFKRDFGEKADQSLVKTYAMQYAKEQRKAKPMDFFSWYQNSGVLKDASENQIKLIKSEFEKIKEDYGTIRKEIKKANGILQDSKEGEEVDKKDLEFAQKVVEKYGTFFNLNQRLEVYVFEGMRQKAVEASKPEFFGGLEKSLKEEKK